MTQLATSGRVMESSGTGCERRLSVQVHRATPAFGRRRLQIRGGRVARSKELGTGSWPKIAFAGTWMVG